MEVLQGYVTGMGVLSISQPSLRITPAQGPWWKYRFLGPSLDSQNQNVQGKPGGQYFHEHSIYSFHEHSR